MNKVMLAGHLGRDPELRYTASQVAVVNVSLATTRKYKGNEETTWHRLVFFGKSAEIISEHMRKGSYLIVTDGRISVREYEDKKRNNEKRQVTEIVVEDFEFGPKGQGNNPGSRSGEGRSSSQSSAAPPPSDDFDDDIPF